MNTEMKKRRAALAFLMGMVCTAAVAADFCASGIANAVPVKDGKAPVIDGRLDDWDLSGEEVCWIADLLAEEQNCKLNFMYDDAALYVGVRMALYDHEYTNANRPGDRYWHGDLIQLRYSTDKSLPFPLPSQFTDSRARTLSARYAENARVGTVNLWRDTKNGRDNVFVTPGVAFHLPATLNPDGSAIKVVTGPKSCTMEVRIPWSVLGCPDGKNPFKPGEMMTACVDVKWLPGTDGHYTAIVYNKDPGAFAFLNPGTWGQIRFAKKGNLKPHGKSMAAVAKAAREAAAQAAQAGATPIRFTIPKKAFVSVNIVDEKGAVVKELMGGELHEPGEVTAYWDGRDQYGFPLETGHDYTWKAYLNDGVDVVYFGTVGTEGVPPYETTDGKGGWGGDHGPCSAAASDATGRYFIWHTSESGKALVKTDFDGKVLWRSSPFVCGGSQGGRLSSCVPAIDRRVAATIPAIAHGANEPYLWWFKRQNGFARPEDRTRDPALVPGDGHAVFADAVKPVDDPAFEQYRYFDPMNFAPDVTCPVYMNLGLMDPCSYAPGVWAIYTRMASADKTLVPIAGHAHDWFPAFDRAAYRWLTKTLNSSNRRKLR